MKIITLLVSVASLIFTLISYNKLVPIEDLDVTDAADRPQENMTNISNSEIVESTETLDKENDATSTTELFHSKL